MPTFVRVLGLWVFACVSLAGTDSIAQTAANKFCPVQTGEAALSEYVVVHRGRKIHFCCESCVEAFKANPEKYLKNIPNFESLPVETQPEPAAPVASAPKARLVPSSIETPPVWRELFRLHWLGIVVGLLGTLGYIRARNLRERLGAVPRVVKLFAHPATIVVLVVVAEVVVQARRIRQVQIAHVMQMAPYRADSERLYERRVREFIHYSTFYDYGFPPRPKRFPGPKKISAVYYRGNDERHPDLFNGGRYLTTTFNVSLRSDDNPVAKVGDVVAGKRPGLRLELVRAPNTPDFFWTKERMGWAYLTRESDPFMGSRKPIPDRVALREVEPAQRWEAVYPFNIPATGKTALRGVVYLCEETFVEGKLAGGRFHYAIEVDLVFQDGKILPESDIWMNSTYRGRKFAKFQILDEEWFSDKPIPVKPDLGTTDRKALGISDYEKAGDL